MPKVKICGVTNIEDAEAAVDAGADALGYIFHEKSARNITPETAAKISQKIRSKKDVEIVAVFVNKPVEYVRKTARDASANVVQLHGQESPEECRQFLDEFIVSKAFGIDGPEDAAKVDDYAGSCDRVLLDKPKGGTGETFPWEYAVKVMQSRMVTEFGIEVVLAGGLNPFNVAEVVVKVDPPWVDTSTGVEVDGKKERKDHEKMAAFLEGAKIPKVLMDIARRKKVEVADLYEMRKVELYESTAKRRDRGKPGFYDAITAQRTAQTANFIGEFKKNSPSNKRHGGSPYRDGADPIEAARDYVRAGVCAMSVLTDKEGFDGSLLYLNEIRDAFPELALLRKEFTIDKCQIPEARYHGADAVLLISALLSVRQMREFIAVADSFGMDCLVESHTKYELDKALAAGARICGINNRDLRDPDYPTDIETTLNLMEHVPEGLPIISESGVLTHEHMMRLSHPRISAVLVGTGPMRAPSIYLKTCELRGINPN